MAVSITPGYDFTVNEVPKYTTVQQMATGLTIQGLTFDNVDATLIGQKTGNESGGTGASLPAEAWMWASPDGTIWVDVYYTSSDVTEVKTTPLWNPGGGWVTSRFKYVRGATLLESHLGTVASPSTAHLANANNPEEVEHFEWQYDVGSNAYFWGLYSYETPSTDFSGSRMLIAGRGLNQLAINSVDSIPKAYPAPGSYAYRWTLSGSGYLTRYNNHSPAAGVQAWFLNTGGQSPFSESSGASWIRRYMGYIYSTAVWGP